MQQEQDNLYSALCTVQELLAQSDTDILTDRERTLNYLAGILADDRKSRNRMRMFYDSGAVDVLVRADLPADQLCRRAANTYMRYTDSREDVAVGVAGAVIRALGMALSEDRETDQSAQRATGAAKLPDVRKELAQLRAKAMLRDGATGENKQRLSEQIEEMMGELFCTLMDSKLVEEQEQLLDRLYDASGQEKEAIRFRLRQIYRLAAEYGADVNLAANVAADSLDAEKMAARQDPMKRASIELNSLVFRQRKARGEESRQLEEQIEKKLDEFMILLEQYEEEPEPQPERPVPGSIVPTLCSRVRLDRRDLVLQKALQDQDLWDSWPEGRQILEGSIETFTYETLDRLLCVFEKGAQTDPDCMQLLADLYYAGMDSNIGRFHVEGVLLPRNRQKSQYWEKKAAEAGHCIALFNQGLEALMAGDLARAEELGRRSAQSTVGEHISDGHFLLALVEMVRWKQRMDGTEHAADDEEDFVMNYKQYHKILEELSAALSKGQGSQENRQSMRHCSAALNLTYGREYGYELASKKEYYCSRLSIPMQRLYRMVERACITKAGSVQLPGLHSEQELTMLMEALEKDHPEMWYVDFRHMPFTVGPDGRSFTYHIRYTAQPAPRQGWQVTGGQIRFNTDPVGRLGAQISDRVGQTIVQIGIRAGVSPEEKCRRIHDWLIQNVRYDEQAMADPDSDTASFDVRGVFLNGRAVCEGIAKAFLMLCQSAGVDCMLVQGTLHDSQQGRDMSHAWNIVQIGEHFAHVDVTADLGMSTATGQVRYDYYLIPDEWARADHGYGSVPPCPVCGLSWFERSGNCVSGTGELKKLAREQLAGGKRTLYFKALGKMPPSIADHIHSTVGALAAQVMPGGYNMHMVPNPEQNVYFIEFDSERR